MKAAFSIPKTNLALFGLGAVLLFVLVVSPLLLVRIPGPIEIVLWSGIAPIALFFWFYSHISKFQVSAFWKVTLSVLYGGILVAIAGFNLYLIISIWGTI